MLEFIVKYCCVLLEPLDELKELIMVLPLLDAVFCQKNEITL